MEVIVGNKDTTRILILGEETQMSNHPFGWPVAVGEFPRQPGVPFRSLACAMGGAVTRRAAASRSRRRGGRGPARVAPCPSTPACGGAIGSKRGRAGQAWVAAMRGVFPFWRRNRIRARRSCRSLRRCPPAWFQRPAVSPGSSASAASSGNAFTASYSGAKSGAVMSNSCWKSSITK